MYSSERTKLDSSYDLFVNVNKFYHFTPNFINDGKLRKRRGKHHWFCISNKINQMLPCVYCVISLYFVPCITCIKYLHFILRMYLQWYQMNHSLTNFNILMNVLIIQETSPLNDSSIGKLVTEVQEPLHHRD